MKTCTKCKQVKYKSAFYKCARLSDGLRQYCKSCCADNNHKYYESLTAGEKESYIKERKSYTKNLSPEQKTRYNRHKRVVEKTQSIEKYQARRSVQRAVSRGALTKQPCFFCGSTEHIEGHHTDYSKRLDVIWVCGQHHREIHSGNIAVSQ